MRKKTDESYPALQPQDTESIIVAEFDLDELAEARHRCCCATFVDIVIWQLSFRIVSALHLFSGRQAVAVVSVSCPFFLTGSVLLAAAGGCSGTGGLTYTDRC